jgi:hypothetical protein
MGEFVQGFTLNGYTYWPYDDVNNNHKLLIIAFDSHGVEKKRFSFDGYRYVSAINVDADNEKVQFVTQGNSFTVSWLDLEVE